MSTNNSKKHLFFILIYSIYVSCGKDNQTAQNNDYDWSKCSNKIARDVDFRIGIWLQPKIKKPSIAKLVFTNDSFMEVIDKDGNKTSKVLYKFDSCNSFKYIKYWLIQLPNSVEFEFYNTSYNSDKAEWYLIKRDFYIPIGQPGAWDTFAFKKQ